MKTVGFNSLARLGTAAALMVLLAACGGFQTLSGGSESAKVVYARTLNRAVTTVLEAGSQDAATTGTSTATSSSTHQSCDFAPIGSLSDMSEAERLGVLSASIEQLPATLQSAHDGVVSEGASIQTPDVSALLADLQAKIEALSTDSETQAQFERGQSAGQNLTRLSQNLGADGKLQLTDAQRACLEAAAPQSSVSTNGQLMPQLTGAPPGMLVGPLGVIQVPNVAP